MILESNASPPSNPRANRLEGDDSPSATSMDAASGLVTFGPAAFGYTITTSCVFDVRSWDSGMRFAGLTLSNTSECAVTTESRSPSWPTTNPYRPLCWVPRCNPSMRT